MAAKIGQELPFPRAELDQRMARVRAKMAESGLDAVLLYDPENVFYLTGYQSIGYFTYQALLVPLKGEPVLISRVVNKFMAEITPTIGRFVATLDTDDPIDLTLKAIADLAPRGKLGVETNAWYLNVPAYQALVAKSGWTVVDFNGVVEWLRIVKSPAEIDRIRRAARAAEAGMHAALEASKPGANENDVAAAMHQASIAAGSEYLGHAPIAVSGERTAVTFAMWRRRTLVKGDVLFLETGGCIDRYHGLLARCAVLGKPTDEMRRMADAIIGGLNGAIAAIKPGATSGDCDHACRGAITKAGYGERFVHRTAYAVGIGFPPNWAEGKTLSLRKDDPTPLQPGMTFHIVPSVFGGEFGMCFSETVLVTETGSEVITQFPRELLVRA